MWQFLKTRWDSLIFRLLFYFLLSTLALALVLAISFTQRIKPHLQNEILPNLERYIEYLIADIGDPPDLVVAQRLADELPFELGIEGPGINWRSSPRLKQISSYDFKPAPARYRGVYVSHHRHDEYLLVKRQGYEYLFTVDNAFRKRSERRHGILFAALATILVLLYLAIRRMFKPVGEIGAQVERIGAGDLGQMKPPTGRGELAQLAAGINRMSAQIKTMLESKSALLLAISHELRSPMTRMRVNLELLEPGELQQSLIEDIREMESLVNTILESEKLNTGHAPLNLERCDLAQLAAEVAAEHECGHRIKSRLTPVEARIDIMRIGLLLKNLIDNACRYSDEKDGPIELRLSRLVDGAQLEIQDHGIGIAAEDLERITEAFYRPDASRLRDTGGYGLGLYLCRLIVEAHGGRLSFTSTPGSGSTATVYIPIDNS